MLGLVALIGGALVLANTCGVSADQDFGQSQVHQQQHQLNGHHQQHQSADAYGGGQQQIQVASGANNAGYGDSQQQHHGPSKAKKIQIVYIKVPLAKLKPSLDANGTNSYEGQQKDAVHNPDSIDTKAQGSQSSASQQQQQRQISDDELNQFDKPSQQSQLSRPQSLLIPMAVVQTQSENEQPFNGEPFSQQRLQLGSASSNQVIAHAAQPNKRPFKQQPQQQQQQPHMGPLGHGINHGFMSSFLMGEKEKMAQAAKLMHQQNTMTPTVAASTAAMASAPPQQAPSNMQQVSNNNNNNQRNNKPQGGLMPLMMMPFSHMPDNAIGQAYNAAVGQALPMESGSPASSVDPKRGQQGNGNNNNNNYNGGNSGINGAAGSSPGAGSSGSYGANGQGQQDAGSSGSGYQPSAGAFANIGPSSGYGNGINTFGASVAFSDYPTNQQTGSGQQTYGAQSLQTSSSNSNSNNHHHSPSGASQQQADQQVYNNGQKLRQAKKTIIPIVVQVEHAILENNQLANSNNNYNANRQPQASATSGNKYGGQRSHRQLGNKRNRNKQQQAAYNGNQGQNNQGALYGAASNEIGLDLGASNGAQFINAANAQDINQITAAINAENAASAAAALAQADMALGNGSPAYIPNGRPMQQQQQQQGGRQYAALQSAASALLANTHPVIQAAASGGLASVSKLGAKLGEIIALPSMQVPASISSIGASLPSAFSSLTNQMGAQLNQAVRQVAKEHPTAHAFARQVAQHAGIALPNLQQQQQLSGANANQQMQAQDHQQGQSMMNQMSMAASQQQPAQLSQLSQMSPQAQLQNLKLSIGQNLQTAAAQLMGVHQKANAQSAASLLASPLAALYPQSMNAALKQLSAMQFGPNSQQQQQQVGPMDPHHAQSSSIVSVQQQMNPMQSAQFQQQLSQQQQQSSQQQQPQQQQQASENNLPSSQSALLGTSEQSAKPAKSSLKSKFLSFFQPPKFISNLLSWNDRADQRSDIVQEEAKDKADTEAAAGKAKGAEKKVESALEPKSANATREAKQTFEQQTTKPVEVKTSGNSSASAVGQQQPAKEAKQAELSGSTSKPANTTQQAIKQS